MKVDYGAWSIAPGVKTTGRRSPRIREDTKITPSRARAVINLVELGALLTR